MRVHAVDHPTDVVGLLRLNRINRLDSPSPAAVARERDAVLPTTRTATPAPAPVQLAEDLDPAVPKEPTRADGKAAGVLRLLEEGHFKGVADVRLRINFFEELTARAQADAAPQLEAGAADLVAAVNAKVDELVGTLGVDAETQATIEGLAGDFNDAVEAAVTDSTADGSIDLAALAGALRSVFESLVTQMSELLSSAAQEASPEDAALAAPEDPAPQAESPRIAIRGFYSALAASADPGTLRSVESVEVARIAVNDVVAQVADDGGAAPDDEVSQPVPTLEEALASLTDAFQQALSTFLASVEEVLQLPDPSAPSGNGAAFDKFLSIYNELRGLTSAVDERA
jgi:hypothetical protein